MTCLADMKERMLTFLIELEHQSHLHDSLPAHSNSALGVLLLFDHPTAEDARPVVCRA